MNTEKERQDEIIPANVFAGTEVFARELPDLNKATAAPLPINGEYWSPAQVGEKRRMFFKEMRTEWVIDKQSGEDVELRVAYFVWPDQGRNKIVRQGGVRLSSVFDDLSSSGHIVPGMAFEITYLGKQKTGKGNNIDTWSIVPLATE